MAGRTLCIHPSSRIARENLEVFCDTWAANVNDLSRIAKDLDAAASKRVIAEKQAYMSLPRPGVSCSSSTSSNSPCLQHSFCTLPSDLYCGEVNDHLINNNYCDVLPNTNLLVYGRQFNRENSYGDSGYKSINEISKSFSEKSDELLLTNFCQQMNIHLNIDNKMLSNEIIYSTINKNTILNKSNENLLKSSSAFVKYNRSQNYSRNNALILKNQNQQVSDDLSNVILRQKFAKKNISNLNNNQMAPLAKVEDFEDDEFQNSYKIE